MDIGIPALIEKLTKDIERLETINSNLGEFVSYKDEQDELAESTGSFLDELDHKAWRIEDLIDDISRKVNTLLEGGD